MSLEVLHHQVLPRQLKVIPVVVDLLLLLEVEVVEDLVDGVSLDPEDVPVLALDLAVAALAQGVENAVLEGGLELDGRAVTRVRRWTLTNGWGSALS